MTDPRGIEVLTRGAALIGWQPRALAARRDAAVGRGIAYIALQAQRELCRDGDGSRRRPREPGAIRVRRVACAHDCGLVINPDGATAQIEGNILQTLSRTLFEEVAFDRSRVTSVDWQSYPILRFPDVPEIAHRHRRPAERAAARCRRGRGHAGAAARARERRVRRGRRAAAHGAVHAGSRACGTCLVVAMVSNRHSDRSFDWTRTVRRPSP